MNRLRFYAVGIAAALISVPMYASMQSQPQRPSLVSAEAVLMQALNSKSARQGQGVNAKLTSNVKTNEQMELPKGTVLTGKVEQIQTGQPNGNGSMVSIVFNAARLSNGQAIPIKATLLGAYPPAQGNRI
ncbi:MAG: hypothetical protein ACYCOR_08530 [Acidobacteriaceae bacterium]